VGNNLFRPGGPLRISRVGGNRFNASISIPKDRDGRIARECPNDSCSPGYFKIRLGTGITGKQYETFCPYCRHRADSQKFATQEQQRYAKDLVMREARRGVDRMIRDSFNLGPFGRRTLVDGFIKMEVNLKSAPLPHVSPPFEDQVRRDVVCPSCGLDQTVFGLATWCADCGKDIFLMHVAAELTVVRSMLNDVDRRRELLGQRVASKDLENCLEDAVSIFEAALKALTRRNLSQSGRTTEQVETQLKKVGMTFQDILRTCDALRELVGIAEVPGVQWDALNAAFQKRHPITHNLGVMDRKYLERVQSREREGREIRITAPEIATTLDNVQAAVTAIHAQLFPSLPA